ncbi:MAG TPA: hypothetical protein VHW64_16615 [Nocardioides sp.]|uniref:hypothetical protein n=1 Tax=Nocardioides sp. TaxID=35761 RepID=UPI002E325172|nr:hypothetical protein [Nocardioides sp.]HEX3932325.1 hypothetical protein [Nocardioides sp.]
MSRRLWICGAVVVALVVAGVGYVHWRHDDTTSLRWAVDHAPAGAQRLSWTDWAAVREQEHTDLGSTSSATRLHQFLSRAYDDDLSSASALVTSARVLQQRFGFSPASADWELFSQAEQGAVVMLHLPSADLSDVADRLGELGFRAPSDPDGVWDGGPDLLARISPGLTGELQYVAVDTHDSLVLTSDSASYLAVAVAAVRGKGATTTGLDGVVSDAGEPLSAEVYAGDYACAALAMAHAGAADQAQGRQLLAAAGQVNPYSAFAMSDEPDGTVRVAFEFDGPDTARTNADTRAALARGPAPGQGGSFGERFGIDSVTARGSLVVMRLRPKPHASVLSDLSTGPLLFATC